MATADIYKNPYGSVEETTKKFQPGVAYQKTADPYSGITSPYGEGYQSNLADIIRAQTQANLTGPQAQESARQSRAKMAGAGVLTGSAFDRAQQQVAQSALGQEQTDIAQQQAEARNKDIEFQSNLAFQKAAFGGEQAQGENEFNRNLYLQAAGYDINQPSRLTDQLNAIKLAYPDISKAPLSEQQKYSQLYSQLTGGEYNPQQLALPQEDTNVQLAKGMGFASIDEMKLFQASNPDEFKTLLSAYEAKSRGVTPKIGSMEDYVKYAQLANSLGG